MSFKAHLEVNPIGLELKGLSQKVFGCDWVHLDSLASSHVAFCLRNCLLSKKWMLIAVAAVVAGSSSVTWAEETQSRLVQTR